MIRNPVKCLCHDKPGGHTKAYTDKAPELDATGSPDGYGKNLDCKGEKNKKDEGSEGSRGETMKALQVRTTRDSKSTKLKMKPYLKVCIHVCSRSVPCPQDLTETVDNMIAILCIVITCIVALCAAAGFAYIRRGQQLRPPGPFERLRAARAAGRAGTTAGLGRPGGLAGATARYEFAAGPATTATRLPNAAQEAQSPYVALDSA